LQFGEEYFRNLKYSQREHLIRRHILENLNWASRAAKFNLLDGRGKTALDVGCAYGYAVDILGNLGYDACGVDVSSYSLKKAKKLYQADFIACDIQKGIPFKKDSFDLLTCFEVIEHVAYPLQAIGNMLDACRGVMICTTPNKTVERPIKKVVRDFDETHISVKTKDEWKKCIEKLSPSFFKIETFFDASLRARDKLLFKSFKIPYFGLNLRILIRKQGDQL